jgi:hypothetical protein
MNNLIGKKNLRRALGSSQAITGATIIGYKRIKLVRKEMGIEWWACKSLLTGEEYVAKKMKQEGHSIMIRNEKRF